MLMSMFTISLTRASATNEFNNNFNLKSDFMYVKNFRYKLYTENFESPFELPLLICAYVECYPAELNSILDYVTIRIFLQV